MAKGRKFPTSRSERFLGSFGYNQSSETVVAAPELGEDEVWSMVDDMPVGDHVSTGEWSSRSSMESFGSFNSRPSHHGNHFHHHHHRGGGGSQVGGLSLAFDDSNKTSSSPRIIHQFRGKDNTMESPPGRHVATSAPVNVPDWSKIYRVDSVDSLHDFDDGMADDSSDMVPPHEYLARSRKMAANSVFEGVGRTLKGRDLSRVRDAVWSQTGFDG